MANPLRRLGGGRRVGTVPHIPPRNFGKPIGSDVKAGDSLDLLREVGSDASLQSAALDADGNLVPDPDAPRQAVQEQLANGNWREALGAAPPGTIGQAPIIGDVLKRRYYGDDFERIVDAADMNAIQQRPSHYSPQRTRLPSDAVSDRVMMIRSHDGDSMAAPNGGVMSSVETLEQMSGSIPNFEDAHRGIESHELGHYLDLSNGFSTGGVFTPEEALGTVRDSLLKRLGDGAAVDRVLYAAQGSPRSWPESSELIANIAAHKRNHYAMNGDVPTTREGVQGMFEDMADKAASFDVSDPDFDPWEFGIDPDSTDYPGHWDTYGPDPDAKFGPSKGRSLRGATETEMNLGNIYLEADPQQRKMMIEDFLRSVDNNDIRKSLLARTA